MAIEFGTNRNSLFVIVHHFSDNYEHMRIVNTNQPLVFWYGTLILIYKVWPNHIDTFGYVLVGISEIPPYTVKWR